MTIEALMWAQLDALLERQPTTDAALALKALRECADVYGEPVVLALIAGALPVALALEGLAEGFSREEVGRFFAAGARAGSGAA